MKQKLIILASTFSFVLNSIGQTLDPSFGNGGKLILSGVLGSTNADQLPTIVQPDGKIVVVGSTIDGTNIVVCRLNSDGSFDNGFGNKGKEVLSFNAGAVDVDIQTDGKIIVAGFTAVARLNPDGTPDATFNITGIVNVNISIRRLLIQTDEKIVLAGNVGPSIAFIRLNSDGNRDANFGTAGQVTLPTFSPEPADGSYVGGIVQQSDNKIVVSGFANPRRDITSIDFFVIRFNENGSLDNSFASAGYRFVDFNNSLDFSTSVLTNANNKTTVSGWGLVTSNDFEATRLNEDGSLDNSFNGTGKVYGTINNNPTGIFASTFQTDGKLLLAGYSYNGANPDFGIIRINVDGTLDNSFNGTGSMSIDFNNSNDRAGNVVALPGGQILLTGNTNVNGVSELALARLSTAITINDINVYESEGQAVLTVTLSQPSTQATKINYNTIDGTAISKGKGKNPAIDFIAAKGTLTIPAGSLTGTISITIINDGIAEPDEYFDVVLSILKNVNATISDGSGRVTILDGSPTTQAKAAIIEEDKVPIGGFLIKSTPNPTNNSFTVTLSSSNRNEKIMLRIIDINGRVIETRNNIVAGQTLKIGWNYRSGIYLVEAIQGKERKTLTLIKQ